MKLGFGLYKTGLNKENFQFAKQVGATHIVAHVVDYTFNRDKVEGKLGAAAGCGYSGNKNKLWSYEELSALKKAINDEGMELAAIENFDPSHWYDILLDGPEKKKQMENIKSNIRNVGKAGIPCIGYNFSLAGVWGWVRGPFARGNAMSVGFEEDKCEINTPIPKGMVWNMMYEEEAGEGNIGIVEEKVLWNRFEEFVKTIMPVAEEAGVRMALHPDDPPMPQLRGTSRLVNQPYKYEKVMNVYPSQSNGIEFCMGTIQEMSEGNIYDVLDKYSKEGKIVYVHFRNVKGKVPYYHEVFVDEGDIDMIKALRILKKNHFEGVLIPDHTPEMSCSAPWHAGMAYAMGYMRAAMQIIKSEPER